VKADVSATLLSIPEAPAPPGRAEWFEGAQGARLRAAIFPAQAPLRGSVVLSPGRTEPIEKYFEVVAELTSRGFIVLAHDWRGQGASFRLLPDRLLGHAEDADDFIEDYKRLLAKFGSQLAGPVIGFGHSMGGCLTLLAIQDGVRFDAAILSAPMLCIRTPGPNWFIKLLSWIAVKAGLAGRRVPVPIEDPVEDAFDTDKLTHDLNRHLRFKAQLKANPDLALGHPTFGWLNFALDATRMVRKRDRMSKVTMPVTIVAAGGDRIIRTSVSRKVASELPNGRYVEVVGAYHEIMMETDERRAFFWEAFDDLVTRLPAAEAAAKGRSQTV
jgi:lysophospholipase